MATVTKPILLDETGKEIIKAINGVSNALKDKTIGDIADNYGAFHNSIYRGKDLTSYFASGEMSQAIANGTFRDIYIGDYIIKPITIAGTVYNVKWLVADFDYFLSSGDYSCDAHHIVLIPDVTVEVNVSMNDTNDTTGAYIASKMWTEKMPQYAEAIKAAFGEAHVVKHRELLTTVMNATSPSAAGAGWVGSSTDWAWVDVLVNIPNEQMIYGGTVFGSSGFDVGNATKQLALFRFRNFSIGRKWFWLRAVASASRFCAAGDDGVATYGDAANRNSGDGVRPYFLLR